MADETSSSESTALPSVPDGFRGNKVYGRLLTRELPSPPPKLLSRKPGRCSEPLEQAQKVYDQKSLFDKLLTPKDAWGNPKDQLAPKLFKQQCEEWPDQMPEWFLDEQQQRLNEHLSGRISLPPEESLRLRRDLALLNDIYRPGPRYEAALSGAEQAFLDERNLRFGNSLSMALLGPIFGGPAAITRVRGGTEQQVAAANQMGAIVLDLVTTRTAMRGRMTEPTPVYRQTYGLYIGPKRIYDFKPPLTHRHRIRNVKQGGVKKEKNTVAEPGIDMRADVEAINNGQGTRNKNLYTINDRTYERVGNHLVPHSGPGFHDLDRGAFEALGILNKFGDTPRGLEIATLAANPAAVERALKVWRLGQ